MLETGEYADFKMGEVVVLKSGSPNLVVSGIPSRGKVELTQHLKGVGIVVTVVSVSSIKKI